MTIREFVDKAIEGGFKWEERCLCCGKTHEFCRCGYEPILLQCTAWQAVGKVEGWDEEKGAFMYEWTTKMHFMIDALAEGKTILEYLETL